MNDFIQVRLPKTQGSQKALADAVGVSEATVSRWVGAESSPHPSHWLAIADYFEVPFERIEDLANTPAAVDQPALEGEDEPTIESRLRQAEIVLRDAAADFERFGGGAEVALAYRDARRTYDDLRSRMVNRWPEPPKATVAARARDRARTSLRQELDQLLEEASADVLQQAIGLLIWLDAKDRYEPWQAISEASLDRAWSEHHEPSLSDFLADDVGPTHTMVDRAERIWAQAREAFEVDVAAEIEEADEAGRFASTGGYQPPTPIDAAFAITKTSGVLSKLSKDRADEELWPAWLLDDDEHLRAAEGGTDPGERAQGRRVSRPSPEPEPEGP